MILETTLKSKQNDIIFFMSFRFTIAMHRLSNIQALFGSLGTTAI